MDMRIEYFEWLCRQINGNREPYYFLLRQLYRKEFYTLIKNDENRAEDGKELRELFGSERGIPDISEYVNGPCTMLEMIIALGNRMWLILEDSSEERSKSKWFWELVNHLDLLDFTDDNYLENGDSAILIDEKLNTLLERRYSEDGYGGLFPLRFPETDQREVEIWYQMHAWLGENCSI